MEGVQNAIDDVQRRDRRRPALGRGPVQGLGHRDLRATTRTPTSSTSANLDFGPDYGQLDDPARQRPLLRRPRPVQGRDPERVLPPQQGRPAADGAAVRHELRDVPQPGSDLQLDPRRRRHVAGRAAHRVDTHWYASYESQSDNVLNVDYAVAAATRSTSGPGTSSRKAGTTASSRPLVGGEWVTVPLVDDDGTEVTTDDEPARQQRGRQRPDRYVGRRRTSSTTPTYIHLTAELPGGHDRRPLPLLDRRGVPRHRLVRGRRPGQRRGGDASARPRATGSRRPACRTTTGCSRSCRRATSPRATTPPFETQDEAGFVYRFEGDEIARPGSRPSA